jgi:RNA polymerase sigma-70 factor (ECF subfamily)
MAAPEPVREKCLQTDVSPLTLHGNHGESMPATLSFEELYHQYVKRIYYFCLTKVGNRAVAEDLAADTFQRAWGAFARVDQRAATLEPWLFRIARNVITDHYRGQRRWLKALINLQSESTHASDVENDMLQHEDVRVAFGALAHLKDRDRTLIGLRAGASLSYAAIGEILGVPERTASKAGQRAFERLRRLAEGGQ